MPLYLSEDDVDGLLTPEEALEAVEGSFRRLAEGAGRQFDPRVVEVALGVLEHADETGR